MIGIASFPPIADANPYQSLFYGALREHGIEYVPGLVVSDEFLTQNHGRVHAIHFHWAHETIWNSRGSSFFSKARGIVGMMRFFRKARRLGIQVIWTMHNIEAHEGASTLDKIGTRALAHAADLRMCLSDWAGEQLLRIYGGTPQRTMVIPHGNFDGVYPAPRDPELVRTEFGLPADRKFLFCFGLLRPYKGFELAIDAMQHVAPDCHLVVAGHPVHHEYVASLQQKVQGLPNVSLIARSLSNQELADIAGLSHGILMPYKKITGSSVLLAAMTLGRGVVATDLPYFREILADEPQAGVLCAHDPAAFAEGIAKFLSVDVVERSAAARRLADRYKWVELVNPFAKWLLERITPNKAI